MRVVEHGGGITKVACMDVLGAIGHAEEELNCSWAVICIYEGDRYCMGANLDGIGGVERERGEEGWVDVGVAAGDKPGCDLRAVNGA